MATESLILKYLAVGKTQFEISDILKETGIKPNSLSHIEKTLNQIRKKHSANTMFHLGVILMKKELWEV